MMLHVLANQLSIAEMHKKNRNLLASVPGLLLPDILSREEKAGMADFNFRVDKLTEEFLAPAMLRLREKGDGMPAYLTLTEAQIVFGFRFITNASFGSMHVKAHEKKRIEIITSVHGR